jgi:hypothetical protein
MLGLDARGSAILDLAGTSLGFRLGDRGTHSSRTMMLSELAEVLAATAINSPRSAYEGAILEDNVTHKRTTASRVQTRQRLLELYALDIDVPLFRIFRRLWDSSEESRPTLALLLALARDPLLRATASPVLTLRINSEVGRQALTDALQNATGLRLNPAVVDKVVRNCSSSWTQSGHLEGRTRKFRREVTPSPASVTFALVLGHLSGQRGRRLFETGWMAVFDGSFEAKLEAAAEAKRLGWLDLRFGGEVFEVGFPRLLTPREEELSRGLS